MSTTMNRRSGRAFHREHGTLQHFLNRSQRFLLIGLPLTFLVIWAMVPILWAFMASLKEPLEIYESNTFFPRDPSLEAYKTVLAIDGFGVWMFNSVLVTVVATIVPLILSILAAYGFSRYFFRFRHVLLLLYLIPRIIPRVSLIVPLNDLMTNLGLINTYWVLYITYIASAVPLSTWILVGFFKAVPREIEESATIDGANMWNRLRYVILQSPGQELSLPLYYVFAKAGTNLRLS